jgi:hypothetical protein
VIAPRKRLSHGSASTRTAAFCSALSSLMPHRP